MNIKDIIKSSEKPSLYAEGTAFMWDDPYISKNLLDVHLNPEIDLASRKTDSIKLTSNWIIERLPKNKKLNILDLGCGPGLYAEILTKAGHKVTGVDISQNSIHYAKESAKRNNLNIEYINENYLNLDIQDKKYDVIIMIYTDLGVLLPSNRLKLLNFIHKSLKKGGMFIFDLLKDSNLNEKISPKSWTAENGGFWSDKPHIALSESFLYQPQKVILSQHIILDDEEIMKIYRFWTHFFSMNDINEMLKPFQFENIEFSDKVLQESDHWNGDNVIFTAAYK